MRLVADIAGDALLLAIIKIGNPVPEGDESRTTGYYERPIATQDPSVRQRRTTLRDVLFDIDGVLLYPWRFRNYLVREHGIRNPSQLLLVDDAAGNVDVARAEGWAAVLYTGPESLEEL